MNGSRVLCEAVACLALACPGRTADTPAPLTARARAALHVKELRPDEPFLQALEKFKGERVLIPMRFFDAWDERPVAPATKLLGRLQNFCEAYTPKDKGDQPDMIPFGVRGTWVVAPETQPVINYDYRFVDPKSARTRNTALTDAVLGIPDAQITAAGSDQGIPVSALPADVQVSLMSALHPPLKIAKVNRSGEWGGFTSDAARLITESLNPKSVQFRMRLRVAGVMLRSSTGPSYSGHGLRVGAAKPPSFEVDVNSDLGGVNLEAVRNVPNKFKATDLDGARYTQPLGIHGVQNASTILERVEQVTGLKVHAASPWAGTPIYVGNDAVTCGEALDGLRLIFTGSWRRVGNVYFLCWEREGLRRLQSRWNKAASPVIEALKPEGFRLNDERWLTLAMLIPFAPDDPMRWTAEQRQTLFGALPTDKSHPFPSREGIFYPAMTPEQQAVVRASQTVDETMPPPKPGTNPAARPLTADELSRVSLSDSATLEIEVKIADLGWVPLPLTWPSSLQGSVLEHIRFNQSIAEQLATQPQTRLIYRFPVDPRGYRVTIPEARESALMVRAVPPSALPALAKSLKASGVTTLIYPILCNGYATLPGTPLPLDPVLKGANGFAAAVKAGNAAGLRVFGSIDVLGWRERASTTHWLDNRADFLDRDEFGQTRSQWIAGLGDAGLDYRLGSAIGGDIVRVASPDVVSRLTALVEAAAKTPGAQGIVFDRWEQSPNLGWMGIGSIPRMGYGEPDRVAAILQDGKDPIDEPAPILSFQINQEGIPAQGTARRVGVASRTFKPIGMRSTDAALVEPVLTPEGLLDRLTQCARKADPTWKVWTVKEGADSTRPFPLPSDRPAPPMGNATLYTMTSPGLNLTPNFLVRVPSKSAVANDPRVDPAAKQWPAIALPLAEQFRFSPFGPAGKSGFATLVYDFRGATEDPISSLKWLKDQSARVESAARPLKSKPTPGM